MSFAQPKLEQLRSSLPYRAMHLVGADRGFKNPPHADHTPVRLSGGIGDMILGVRAAEILNDKVGDVVVYTKHHEAARMFTFLPVKPDEAISVRGFDFYIALNCTAVFHFSKNFKGFLNTDLEQVFIANQNFMHSGGWGEYARLHPYLDCSLANMAVKAGHTRETIAYEYLGLKPEHRRVTFEDDMPVPKYPYITVHDGFDSDNKEVVGRSTKSWSLKSWSELIKLIKQNNISVIQLGGPTSRSIRGVDIDFVGALNFKQSSAILARSELHIDGDSGLVHAARAFGVTSIVLFGSTNADFFGYRENVNLKPSYCGGCWWLKPNWMSKCAMGHETPECMDSHEPEDIAKKVETYLRFKQKWSFNGKEITGRQPEQSSP